MGLKSKNKQVTDQSTYIVKERESDGVWCIYYRKYNVVVAEFGKANKLDAEAIKSILESQPS